MTNLSYHTEFGELWIAVIVEVYRIYSGERKVADRESLTQTELFENILTSSDVE